MVAHVRELVGPFSWSRATVSKKMREREVKVETIVRGREKMTEKLVEWKLRSQILMGVVSGGIPAFSNSDVYLAFNLSPYFDIRPYDKIIII